MTTTIKNRIEIADEILKCRLSWREGDHSQCLLAIALYLSSIAEMLSEEIEYMRDERRERLTNEQI